MAKWLNMGALKAPLTLTKQLTNCLNWPAQLAVFFQRSELTSVLATFKREFVWVGLFSLLANLLMLTPTLYMLQIYDRVMLSQNQLTLLFLTLIVLVFYGVMAFAEWLRSRLLVQAGLRLDQQLNSRVFNASFEAFLRRTQQNPTEAFNQLTNLRQFLTGNGIFAFFDAPWTPIYIAVVFILHPWLGVLSVIFAGIQLYLAFWSSRRSQGGNEAQMQADSKSRAYLQSKLKNAEPVEAMGMLDNLRARWLQLFQQQQQLSYQAQHQQHRQQSIIKFIRYSMQSFTLGAAALLVIKGELSAGAMIAANVLMSRALQPLDLIVGSWRGFLDAKAAFAQLENILRDYPTRDAALQHKAPSGALTLKKLSAFAPDKQSQILHGISLQLPAGKVTCVIGPSGSGKSTLARCLVGIWPDYQGQLLLDKTPIEQWEREQLGPHIGYLPQDIELFDGTIAENIARFYEVDADLVIQAAKQAGIHDMVLRFAKGYDTSIGEAGGMLSGGQRQRIALARAMYGNPQLMVLDEPNANLDDIGEKALVAAIQSMKAQGKTVVLITHRLNILGVADDLLVMREGKVLHHGPREQVIQQMQGKPAPAVVPIEIP